MEESVGALKDQKELVSARIDELEIAMISARGQKLTRLAAELDGLEEEKAALKKRIKAAVAAAAGPKAAAVTTAVQSPSKKPAVGRPVPATAAPPPVEETSDAGLRALEDELRELERKIEEKEDEERRLRFEMDSRKNELYSEEAAVWEREQRVLKVAMDMDPTVKHAVRLQRLFRARKARRKWAGGVPRVRPIVEQYVQSEEAKPWHARWSLLVDVCKSQDQYAACLVVVRDKYALPLRKTNSTVSGVGREDIQEVFGTLEVLSSFEEDVAKALHHRIYSRFSHPSVGDVLLKLSSIFPLYVEYCRNLDHCFSVMARLQKTPLVGAYMEKLFLASGSRAPLTTLMELPAQRLFLMETILGALAQLTPPSHADSSRLRSVHKAAADAVAEVKVLQEERKAHQKLAAMARKIQGLPESVIAPGRKLLYEQDVTLIDRKRVLQRLFLFGDCVVLASVSGKSLKFVEQIPLVGLRFNSLPDNDTVYNCFELMTMSRVWQYVCDTFDAKSKLEDAFLNALRNANSNLLLDGQHLSSHQLSTRGHSMSFALQRVRLESETQSMAENVARLPKDALESLKLRKYTGLVQTMEEEPAQVLGGLDRDTLLLAAQALDAEGKLLAVIRDLQKTLVTNEPSAASLSASLTSEIAPLACVLATCAAAFCARPWLAALLGKHVVAVKQRKQPEEVAKAIVKDAISSLRDVPPLIQAYVASLSKAAQKKFKSVGDNAAFVFFGAAFLLGAWQWPVKFGLCDRADDISDAYVQALRLSIVSEAETLKKPLLDACKAETVAPTVSKTRCESEIMPALVQGLVRSIEDVASEKVVRALALCIVLK